MTKKQIRAKLYYIKNKEKLDAQNKANYEKNKEAHLERCRRWQLNNKEKFKAYHREYYTLNKARFAKNSSDGIKKLRQEMIIAYGSRCVCCEETTPEFLTIDHIYNDGHKERKNGVTGGYQFYRRLKHQGWPQDRYQLLCMNCNCAKQWFKRCPHSIKGERQLIPQF